MKLLTRLRDELYWLALLIWTLAWMVIVDLICWRERVSWARSERRASDGLARQKEEEG